MRGYDLGSFLVLVDRTYIDRWRYQMFFINICLKTVSPSNPTGSIEQPPAFIGETPIMVLPHLISNFVRFNPQQSTPAILSSVYLNTVEFSKWSTTSFPTSSLPLPPSTSARTSLKVSPPKHRTSAIQGLMYNSLDEELIKHGLESDVW